MVSATESCKLVEARTAKPALAGLVRLAPSVWVAVRLWLPSAKVALVVMSNTPPTTVPVPTATLPPSA